MFLSQRAVIVLLVFCVFAVIGGSCQTATITVSGTEIQNNGGWDSGIITVNVNGYTETVQYGQYSTSTSIAAALGAEFARDNIRYGLWAKAGANGTPLSTVTFQLSQGTSFGPISVVNPSLGFSFGGTGFGTPTIADFVPAAASEGTILSIAGSGFGSVQANSIVTISGIVATVSSWSTNSIRITVPKGAASGSGVVVVTVNGYGSTPKILQFATTVGLTLSPTTSTYAQTVTTTVAVSSGLQGGPTPTGTVSCSGANQTGSIVQSSSNPVAVSATSDPVSLTFMNLPVGTDTVTCNFSGTGNFANMSNSAVETVHPSVLPTVTISLVSSTATPAYGDLVTFTAVVTPVQSSSNTPTGAVQLVVDGVNSGPPVTLSGNTAIFSIATLSLGTHSVVANYSGDVNFASGASSAITETVSNGVAPCTPP